VTILNNGATFVTNGALVPANAYAQSLGILRSNCSQTLFESTADHVLGDVRFISVGPEQDKDGSLDQIIRPFEW
jgi:hypothetical protein